MGVGWGWGGRIPWGGRAPAFKSLHILTHSFPSPALFLRRISLDYTLEDTLAHHRRFLFQVRTAVRVGGIRRGEREGERHRMRGRWKESEKQL